MIVQYGVGETLLTYAILGTLMTCGVLIVSWLVRPMRKRVKATEPYECGMAPIGESRAIGFSFIGYAVLFLLFDLAAIYLLLFALLPTYTFSTTLSFALGLVTLFFVIYSGTKRRDYRAT